MIGANIELRGKECEKGYLDDYEFESIEMNKGVDSKNGGAIVHYKKNGKEYSLEVELVNGLKEGKGRLFDSKHVVIGNLEFVNDELNGECVIRNDKYVVVFRGMMKNGVKEGECHEYDEEGKEVFYGIIKDGRRIPLLSEVKERKGLYREYDSDGCLLSVSEYDSDRCNKNGVCYVIEGGVIKKECVMENGREVRVLREMEGERMIEYDDRGNKRYEGGWIGDWIEGVKRNGRGKEYNDKGEVIYEGEFDRGDRCVVLMRVKKGKMKGMFEERSKSGELLSVGEYKKKGRMKEGRCFEYRNGVLMRECLYEKNEMKEVMREWKGGVMIEYEGGVRVYEGGYKGSVEDGFVREGEGEEYVNDGNELVYSGGFVNGVREGRGRVLKNGIVIYEGEMKYGYPNGKGRRMNEDGDVSYRGEWKNGYLKEGRVVIDFESGDKRGCVTRCSLRMCENRFHVWWHKKSKCKRFWCGLLFWILMIVILSFPFYTFTGYTYMGIRIAFNSDLRIHNCWEWEHIPMWWSWKVKSLTTDYGTCWDSPWIRSFDLSRYKNLKSLYVGGRSFEYVKQLELKGLKKLESVDIEYPFNSVVGTVSFNNYPKLKDLKMKGFNSVYSLEIKDLNSLESLIIREYSFRDTRSLMMDSNNELHKLILRSPFY